MKRIHSGLCYVLLAWLGLQSMKALSVPCKRSGHYWVDLVFSSFVVVNVIQMYQINSAVTSFVTKMTKITENYFTIQQFWSFRQGWSKVEGLVLSKWVQTVVENPSGRFRTTNPCHQSSTSLYTVQTWLPHTSHKGHKIWQDIWKRLFLKKITHCHEEEMGGQH